MKTATKTLGALIASGFLMGSLAQAAILDVTFGSANDGFGGFTSSAPSGTEVWTNEPGSVNYAFGELNTDEGRTASLLQSLTLNKGAGAAYTIEGVVTLTGGYGDDNNRIGILLFNNGSSQTSDGGGGLYLRLNADDNRDVAIADGINGTNQAPLPAVFYGSTSTGVGSGDNWIGQTLTFTADLTFRNNGVNDVFDVDFTLIDGSSNEYNSQVTDLLTSTYSGTHFGFASKWRQRGDNSSNRNVPAEFDYQSFSVTQTAIPEPSTLALLGIALGSVFFFRRRK